MLEPKRVHEAMRVGMGAQRGDFDGEGVGYISHSQMRLCFERLDGRVSGKSNSEKGPRFGIDSEEVVEGEVDGL